MMRMLQQLLVDAARRSPAAIAVDAERGSVTYQELERLSNQLTRALQSRGVQRGDRVGIIAPKSVASVIAVFAALKSGACYVPLDASSPDERLELIIADADIEVLLADQASAARAVALLGRAPRRGSVIVVDPARDCGGVPSAGRGEVQSGAHAPERELVSWTEVLARPGDAVSEQDAAAGDLAYILYTSGSTGVPKGVMISHRASLTFVEWAASCAQLTPRDRVCSPAPLHFDLSVFDIFATCSAGATMVVLPPRTAMFPVRLGEWIQDQGISVWYSVPSVLTMLAMHGNLGAYDLSALRTLIFAGEVFPAKHLSLLIAQLPDTRFLNWYGPTETNVCTWYEVPGDAAPLTAPVPIGRACTNVDAFAVTDAGRRVSSVGEEGELFVAGPGLMSGYWRQPERTLEALVLNQLAGDRGERVYRTGDIVILDEQGDFLFLGRRDGMVKTRGYRVELGEVESVLYEHPAVREAVVLPVPDELLGNRLRAVISPEHELGREDVLDHCRRRLPVYMVPDTIEFSETLPRTSTGKIDRVLLGSR